MRLIKRGCGTFLSIRTIAVFSFALETTLPSKTLEMVSEIIKEIGLYQQVIRDMRRYSDDTKRIQDVISNLEREKS